YDQGHQLAAGTRRLQYPPAGIPSGYLPGSGEHRTEQDHQNIYRGRGHFYAPYPDREHLRNELQPDAGNQMGLRISLFHRTDDRLGGHYALFLPQERLALA